MSMRVVGPMSRVVVRTQTLDQRLDVNLADPEKTTSGTARRIRPARRAASDLRGSPTAHPRFYTFGASEPRDPGARSVPASEAGRREAERFAAAELCKCRNPQDARIPGSPYGRSP